MRPLLYVAAALCLAGCGGAGGLVPFSFFEGSWVGTWDGAIDGGPSTLNIDATGDISGTMHADIGDETGTVSGAIQNNGDVSVSVTFPGDAPVNGTGTLVLTNGGAKLQGVITFAGEAVTFDLDGP